jgi:CheY-like chemotaxis protein
MKVEALIVDDDAQQLDALAEVVQLEGFAVRTAASLGEARERLAERAPDVIISDLMLPTAWASICASTRPAAETEMVLITGQASGRDRRSRRCVPASSTTSRSRSTCRASAPVLANVARTVSVKKEVGNLRASSASSAASAP